MVVLGVVKTMTAETAKRAALGSGAIVTKVVSGGNVLKQPERLKQLQGSRPDIILLAGGTDGGNKEQVIDLAETISAAQVKSRWKDELAPVIFAGNQDVREGIKAFLQNDIDLRIAKNIRPNLEVEQIDNVNLEIQDLYMKNVVQNITSLEALSDYGFSLKPTAVGLRNFVNIWAKTKSNNAILFDIGGLSTDSYSSIEYVRKEYKQPTGNKTITGNMGYVRERKVFSAINASAGLSLGAARLLKTAGMDNICRWIKDCTSKSVFNACFNRMIFPLTHGQADLKLSKALAAEALRISFNEHQDIAGKLHGVSVTRHITETFDQVSPSSGTLAEWQLLDDVILTGGIFPYLSPETIVHIANDALQPSGITNIYLDRKDIISQLAALESENIESSISQISESVIQLATIIAPLSSSKKARSLGVITLKHSDGTKETINLKQGNLLFINDKGNDSIEIDINPVAGVDFGNGPGSKVSSIIANKHMGILIDGRRPLNQDFSYSDIVQWYGENYSNLDRGERNV